MEGCQTLKNLSSYQEEYYKKLKRYPDFGIVAGIVEKFLAEVVASGGFYTRVKKETLPQILRDGEIKSMMETGGGTTIGGPEVRKEVIGNLFGCDVATLGNCDYPKYGYLSHANPQSDLLATENLSYQYGGVVVKLKKERMLRRTTMTIGNSVNFGVSERMIPTPVAGIKATCMPGPCVNRSEIGMRGGPGAYYVFAEAVLNKQLTVDKFFFIDQTIGDRLPFAEYFELQYHGRIDIAEDVESISVCSFDYSKEELEELTSQCEAAGIPLNVYTY